MFIANFVTIIYQKKVLILFEKDIFLPLFQIKKSHKVHILGD